MKNKRDTKLDNKGQAMVEFAITLPVFMLFILIMLWAVQSFVAKVQAQTIACEACRAAITALNTNGAEEAIEWAVEDQNGRAASRQTLTSASNITPDNEYTEVYSAGNVWVGARLNNEKGNFTESDNWQLGEKLHIKAIVKSNALLGNGGGILGNFNSDVSATMTMRIENSDHIDEEE